MVVYHGTTRKTAAKITRNGFQPKSPSRRVWFAKSKGYASSRAHTKARRSNDRPIVLAVDLDLDELRKRYGARRVRQSGGMISINGEVPPSMLRTHYGLGTPESPAEITRWLNSILKVKPHKGISIRHPGIKRLAQWVNNKLSTNPRADISQKQMLSYAMQWIPEHFAGYEVDFDLQRAWPRAVRPAKPSNEGEYIPLPPEDHRAEEAQACLESGKPQRQVRGLKLLAELDDTDLFEWCTVVLAAGDRQTQIGALKVMRQCEDIDPEVLTPYAESEQKAVRAAALEVLGLHGGEQAHEWFWKGLTDPEPHVRLSAVKYLDRLDPQAHRDIFEAALYDPHPQIAQRLVRGKGYTPLKW